MFQSLDCSFLSQLPDLVSFHLLRVCEDEDEDDDDDEAARCLQRCLTVGAADGNMMTEVVFVDEQHVRLVLQQMREFFRGVDGKQLLHKILMKQEPNPTDDLKTVEDDVRQEVGTSPEEKLVETLKCLSDEEFGTFKDVLQQTDMKDDLLQQRLKTSHRAGTVQLMMEVYERRSVDVTSEVLQKMNKRNLMLSLSDISSGSKVGTADGDSRRRAAAMFGGKGVLELQDCGNIKQKFSDWIKLNPEVKSSDPDEAPTFSLQSAAGAFECTVSGLRWVCKEKVAFKYKFCCLDEVMLRIKHLEFTPAGPLMDVTVTAGQFEDVFLPHWIHVEDNPTITDKFAVLTVHECGDVVEKVSEVTSSHVKLPEARFSLRMVLVKAGLSVGINCKVLIYQTNTAFLTLHVFMIPDDPGLQQELDRKNLSSGYTRIKKPYPEKHLTMNHRFILTADLDAAEIYPERLMLRYDGSDPNFFEVFVENPKTNLKLELRQEDERQPIWSCDIRKNEYQTSNDCNSASEETDQPGSCSDGEHFVDEHQVELKRRVSEVGIILDELLHHRVISQESYERIMVLSTCQEKMRELCSLLLKAGTSCKDIFYKILEKNEPHLIADLKKKKK